MVPGVSSAIAAPLLAGIPVTHRGLSAGFLVVSGHAEEAFTPALGSLAPGAATVVILMGLATRAASARLLLTRGWDPQTPAALLLAASTAAAHAWWGTLAELGACDLPGANPDLAGVLVIGATVAVAAQLATLQQAGQGLRAAGR